MEQQCERCGRELDALLDPTCSCGPADPLAQQQLDDEPTFDHLTDSAVRRFINSVLDELEDDD